MKTKKFLKEIFWYAVGILSLFFLFYYLSSGEYQRGLDVFPQNEKIEISPKKAR